MKVPTTNQTTCVNCEAPIAGNFCSHCGQSTSVHRITFRETIKDFFSSTLALEGPLLFTIGSLIKKPGMAFRNFVGGKRKPYYKPVAFFVVLTAIYLIVRSLIDYDPFAGQAQFQNANVHEQARKFIEAGRFMVANINNIMFFLVFAIGVSHKLFFPKKYNLAEYVTIGFFVSGMYVLVGLFHMLFSTYIYFFSPQVNMIILFAYLVYTAASFHQERSFWAVTKYLLIGFIANLLYVFMGYGFSLLVVVTKAYLEAH